MKVLILSVPAGGGHLQTSKALNEYLCHQKDVECKILDIAENAHELFAQMVSEFYLFTSTYMQTGYRLVYNQMDKRTKHSFTATSHMLYQICGKKLIEYIDGFCPDVIVCSHVFATVVLNIYSQKHKINAKIISIVTDLTIHPIWEQTSSDYYIVASENLIPEALKKLGSAHNILPLGIPIKEDFSKKTPKEDALASLELQNKFTVLVMMGSMGYANAAVDLVKQLEKTKDDIQIIAVCGNNKPLKEKLKRLKLKHNIVIYGFCDNISLLMDACDCIVTKPGGLSTAEAMAKNLPIVLTNPIPGQEEKNMEFMQSNAIAISLSNQFTVDKAVSELVHSPFIRETLTKNTKRMAKPHSTRDLVELIYKITN